MNNIAVFGAVFGDEGKARIVNWLAKDFKYVARFSGSSNAGHTLYYNGTKIVRHLLPSADFSVENNCAFLGAGMVINPEELLSEIQENMKIFPNLATKVIVDPDVFIITKRHLEEDKENIKTIGSTGKGVSPAYRDKINRKGTRISDLIKDNDNVILALKQLGVQFKYSLELYEDFEKSNILFEGAQSILLDYNFGMYPYVTSGECGLNGIINAGFAKFLPKTVYGIAKCYSTRVGEGPFPTEIFGEEAEKLRQKGGEFGATTGRPRRVGWLDLPSLDYSCKKGGITDLVITKFDILNGMESIPICTSYEKDPICPSDFFDAQPEYINMPGWHDVVTYNKLHQISDFVDLIENQIKLPVKYISCGVNEDDIIEL